MGCGASSQADDAVDNRTLPRNGGRGGDNVHTTNITNERRETVVSTRNVDVKLNRSSAKDTRQTKEYKKYEKQLRKNFADAVKRGKKEEGIHPLEGLLIGMHQEDIKQSFKVIRIFTSSTFTDTKHERNTLMVNSYPLLKEFCQELGYDFQIVDMRWGIREEADDNHTAIEICLGEVEACQRLSTGPNFVTFLSHKYGYRPIPRCIPAAEFEQLTQDVNEEEKQILNRAFQKDENCIPPEYVLQPISSVYPDFKSSDNNVSRSAWSHWCTDVRDKCQELLVNGAKKHAPEKVHVYNMSVTEREIEKGLLNTSDPQKTTVWFNRTINDIEQKSYSKKLTRYHECTDKPGDILAREMMGNLKEKITKKCPTIVSYNINWDEQNGINPDLPEHRSYLDQMCEEFTSTMKTFIKNGINEEISRLNTDPLQQEITQHSAFRKAKCQQFHGRGGFLRAVKKYLKDPQANTPFIMSGDSGCGKTSVMAKIATEALAWMEDKAVVIYRFIGTSQMSSSIRPLLDSINEQIMEVYAPSMTRNQTTMDLKSLKEEFLLYLSCIPTERPLILVLDSLDQLDSSDGGRQLDWLPKQLPESVRMVLSTLPQEKYVTFPRCKAIYPENPWFYDVPALSNNEVEGILTKWLKHFKRTLTGEQRGTVTNALASNPLPLFLKLSFDEAYRWHSYDISEQTVIQATVIDMINSLFDRVERSHGKELVSYGLGYLTATQVGLTEVEMEDLLSLNDDVLNDVYQFWTPPMRRLPPLLWVRIKNELREYIVSRGADGVQVIYWYHRQFIETATQRYLSDDNFVKKCHLDISHYLMGTWADKAKPYTDKKGKSGEALRYVTKQPMCFAKDKYNIRKLNMLPYHLTKTRDLDLLKTHVLCNYEFLLAKLMALGVRPVLADLKAAQMTFPKDRDISIILETLQLSSEALTHSPTELAGQLTGRIHGYGAGTEAMVTQAKLMMSSDNYDDQTKATMEVLLQTLEKLMSKMDEQNKMLNSLLSQASQSSIPVLVPHTGFLMPPGGQLLHKLSSHLEKINDIDMSKDGKVLATGSDDKTVKFWNVYTGEIIKSVEVPTEVKFIKFISKKRLAISCTMGHIMVINLVNGEVEVKMENDASSEYVARPMTTITTLQKKQDCIVALRNQYVDIFDIKTGKLLAAFPDDLKQHKTRLWGEQKVLTACQHFIVYSAFADDDFYIVPVESFEGVKVYKENVFDEEAEWQNLESKDHISNMAVAEAENQLIICNGKTKDLLFYDIMTRKQLFVLNNSVQHINHLTYSLREHSVYYTADNEVGQVTMDNKQLTLTFRHPCKVLKVVSQDSRVVATVSEDNILRVWDKVMEPFSADMSAFTGQVHVRSDQAGDMIKSMIGDMGSDLGDIDVNSALTTKDTKNYWSKDSSSVTKDVVYTTFHPFTRNERYIMVTQSRHNDTSVVYWTQCLSIWDTVNMQCVRRLFLQEYRPNEYGAMYVHGLVQGQTAVIQEYDFDIDYKLLDLETWETKDLTLHQTAKKVWGSKFKYLPIKNVFLVETSYDRLSVFDLSQLQSVGYLSIRKSTFDWHLTQIGLSFPYRTTAMVCHKFDDIKVSEDESRVVTSWGQSVITVWDTETWDVHHEFKAKDSFPLLVPRESSISLSNICNSRFIVLSASVPCDKDKYNSTCVLNLIGGNVIGHTKCDAPVTEVKSANINSMVAVLQQYPDQGHYLQWIGVGQQGQSFLMDQIAVGPYTNNLMTSDTESHYVTWCNSPLDRTIRLFGVVDGLVKMIGAFTPDEDMYHTALVDEGHSIIINTPSELVKLQLKGKDIEERSSPTSEAGTLLYNDIDLNVKLVSTE